MTERSRVEYWGPYLAGAAVAISFFLLLLAGAYTFRQQGHVNRQLCQQTIDNREAIRRTWDAARVIVLKGQTTQEGQTRTNDFFNAILMSIPPLTCVDNRPLEVG